MSVRVEKTADGVAMMRALEQHAPSPLFDDPLAARMLTGWPAAVVARRPLRWLFLRALERAGPPDVLAGAGAGRTLLICEAVTMYLTDDAVGRVLAYAGGLAPGSRVVVTYLPGAEAGRNPRWSRRLGWRSAYEPAEMAARLRSHGLTPQADLGADDHSASLLRPAGRRLAVFPGERIAVTAT